MNNCSLCQYCHPVEAGDKIDMDYLRNWCSNSKSPNFRYWKYEAQKFVKGSDACDVFTPRTKAPLKKRLGIKGLAGLKSSRRFIERYWVALAIALISILTPLVLCLIWIMLGGR